MRGKALCFSHIVKHKNGTRSVPGGIPTRERGNDQLGAAERNWSAVRPPSLASQAPTIKWCTPAALHHSSGRALARLQLLILICPPLREAEWRCSSGEWRAAPFDAVEHAACRSSRSRPEGSVPGWIPERRNAEPKRGAGRSGRAFFAYFFWRSLRVRLPVALVD
ncbi:hypothetical protein PS880_05242 [Pseudomonas fluorescens]|uniref:Uncharacterized protein n=1 Tax=Pseudomonas fluorescens TaxID=294 RepID=A0A5E7PGY4_PSEFL|nr:hypothetical protein PS880_05242 [Pseudomonas fluorescens]